MNYYHLHLHVKSLLPDINLDPERFVDVMLGCVWIKDHVTQVYIVDVLDQLRAHRNALLLQPGPSDTKPNLGYSPTKEVTKTKKKKKVKSEIIKHMCKGLKPGRFFSFSSTGLGTRLVAYKRRRLSKCNNCSSIIEVL